MQKKVHIILEKEKREIDEVVSAETTEEKILFSLADKSKNYFQIDRCVFYRETKEMILELWFLQPSKSRLYLKDDKHSFAIKLETDTIDVDQKIEINYQLNGENYHFLLESEE